MHEGGLRIERCDDGAWRFIKRNCESIESCAPGHTRPFTHWTALPTQNAEHGPHIDSRTGPTRWGDERMDYGIAIDPLLDRARRRKIAEQTEA